ncbi:MAG: alpha/beta fold hydrolase [Pseudomonadales bacterium]|nr:alpha/beta fold hydrolase [Pseudomonadales bacterium]MCP5330686.1 alpha/beta fold hydrolase [Pseudomonadales bacterium]MCP5344933.1 alpha/beta fold hydrolase [Pseudomonadales bacterium]
MECLSAVEIVSPHNAVPEAAVIWLHGLGADGNDFAGIVPELRLPASLGVRFVFPHAPSIPVTINNGYVMPAWYDILAMDIDRKVDTVQLLRSAAAVHALIEREIARGIDSRRIVLAGFSQGGAVILQAALSCDKPLAGAMSLSSYFATEATVEPNPVNASLPVLVCHGSRDPVVNESLGVRAEAMLRRMGHPTEYHRYPMEHSVCLEEIRDISHWLQARLA